MSEQVDDKSAVDTDNGSEPHPLEQGLDDYQLREPGEDPRWAVRTVWTWVGIAVGLLIFIIALFILGIWYD